MSPEVFTARRDAMLATLKAITKEVERGQAADRDLLRDLIYAYGTLRFAVESN